MVAAYGDWSDGWTLLNLLYAAKDGKDKGNDGGSGGGNGNSGDNGNGNSGGGNGPGSEGNSGNNGNGNANGHGNGQDNAHGNGKASGQNNGNNGKALAFQNRYKAPSAPEYLTETLYFVNDLADPLAHAAAAYDDNGSYTMMNVWEPVSGSLLRSGSSEETQWALTDALASIAGLVSDPASTGRMDWHATYDEFGQSMSHRKFDPSFPQGISYFGFTGEPYDFVTGLTYLRNRYYAPELGRFTSSDPLGAILGDPTTLNGYGYVMNNPLRWVDPWGLGPAERGSGPHDSDGQDSLSIPGIVGSVGLGLFWPATDPLAGTG